MGTHLFDVQHPQVCWEALGPDPYDIVPRHCPQQGRLAHAVTTDPEGQYTETQRKEECVTRVRRGAGTLRRQTATSPLLHSQAVSFALDELQISAIKQNVSADGNREAAHRDVLRSLSFPRCERVRHGAGGCKSRRALSSSLSSCCLCGLSTRICSLVGFFSRVA